MTRPASTLVRSSRILRGLLLLWALAPALPAIACSPALDPRHDLRRSVEGSRTVVIGEVIAVRALGRTGALREHRARLLRTPAPAREPGADARPADGPPPPPPEPVVAPVLPLPVDGLLQVEVFVYENLKGEDPEILAVPAGGPCGQAPRVGQQAVVMVTQGGPAYLVLGREEAAFAPLDPDWLERLRACVRGQCGE